LECRAELSIEGELSVRLIENLRQESRNQWSSRGKARPIAQLALWTGPEVVREKKESS